MATRVCKTSAGWQVISPPRPQRPDAAVFARTPPRELAATRDDGTGSLADVFVRTAPIVDQSLGLSQLRDPPPNPALPAVWWQRTERRRRLAKSGRTNTSEFRPGSYCLCTRGTPPDSRRPQLCDAASSRNTGGMLGRL